ncbi:MAG TPA: tetratricopeptide repeat protein [Thermoanaerobaculia bacterium]|nr:tetratricopeptide repeat protein [Thermoanaerobaculia bacterium]
MADRRLLILALALVVALDVAPLAATCGGGGGGGVGGLGGQTQLTGPGGQTYRVPWKVVRSAGTPGGGSDGAGAGRKEGLVVYWFPTSPGEARASDLQTSRILTLFAARCVAMDLVTSDNQPLRSQFAAAGPGAAVVVATVEGKELARLADDPARPRERRVSAAQVEKLVGAELKSREAALDRLLEAARAKEKQGDANGAAALYTGVWAERCLFPDSGKKAAKALKKLGRPVPDNQASLPAAPSPSLGEPTNGRMVRLMDEGLAAENAGRYERAGDLYGQARRLDPGDPVPLRYLGELERHHRGDWTAARASFTQILAMPADAISRAVALHGLGKMTIHGGDFARGLALFEESLGAYPLPLTYRNLAVYWNSEGKIDKARGYVEQALALEPGDAYNQVFAAAFAAEDGRREEALRIARANEDLLAASYNLAAIYSLSGNRDRALELLRRHFYGYERFAAVRAKEMQEARDDRVFAALHRDPAFLALTAAADGPAGAGGAGGDHRAMPGGSKP